MKEVIFDSVEKTCAVSRIFETENDVQKQLEMKFKMQPPHHPTAPHRKGHPQMGARRPKAAALSFWRALPKAAPLCIYMGWAGVGAGETAF